MNVEKYIGMDVHQETISIALMTGEGKLVMESIIENKASTILQFVQGLHGDLHVTSEEGTWAAWLSDLMKPRVTEFVVWDPRGKILCRKTATRATRLKRASSPIYYVPDISARSTMERAA
jgi:hypothetical protein